MYVDALLRSQFGKPSGLFGALFMGPILNLSNARLVNAAVELLDPRAKDTVLDIGFGGGRSLLALAAKAPGAKIVGVDYSREMVEKAARLIRDRHLEARVSAEWGDVARLPFRARTFHKVLTVNSLYYWPDLIANLREAARVMKRGGTLAAGFRSAASLGPLTRGWQGFALYEPDEFAEIMRAAGFDVLRVEHRDRGDVLDTVVVIGRKPARVNPPV
ncbi:MAG TPA: class I SAM-dependent methyltransferase [Bryobacteraceae bacterium]|nr:class I SAM-dependent methyltransferase [Bryobacteraceae bacterium]